MIEIKIGTESQKAEILAEYPHTKAVIRDGGVLIVAIEGDEITGFCGCLREKC